MRVLLVAGLTVFAGGCVVGPNYVRPVVVAPDGRSPSLRTTPCAAPGGNASEIPR